MYLHLDLTRLVVNDRERELFQTVARERLAAAVSRVGSHHVSSPASQTLPFRRLEPGRAA